VRELIELIAESLTEVDGNAPPADDVRVTADV
jgi:hypothetical protein